MRKVVQVTSQVGMLTQMMERPLRNMLPHLDLMAPCDIPHMDVSMTLDMVQHSLWKYPPPEHCEVRKAGILAFQDAGSFPDKSSSLCFHMSTWVQASEPMRGQRVMTMLHWYEASTRGQHSQGPQR